jgi:hypothetical protein
LGIQENHALVKTTVPLKGFGHITPIRCFTRFSRTLVLNFPYGHSVIWRIDMSVIGSGKLQHAAATAMDDLDELTALARMITYAKAVAEDLKIELGAQSLDLALTAVTRELRRATDADLPGLEPLLADVSIELH